jgi:hypothetical protein
MGDNDWYVSAVEITFTATDDMSGVAETYYRVNGGTWETGTVATVSDDGEHTVEYYSVDNVGNEEDVQGPVDFKIDQTPPTIELEKKKLIGKLRFIATVEDPTSGINKVEFYMNDVLQFTATEEPYQWDLPWLGGAEITVRAVVYDNAGNTAEDSVEHSLDLPAQSQKVLSQPRA